jgi:uncharacterized Fe-S cluster-containing radical SAM superfamily enzyme
MMIGMAIAAKAVKNKGNTNCIFCDIDLGSYGMTKKLVILFVIP